MLIVDPLTGAMYKINDFDCDINTTLQQTSHAQVSKLEIIDINSLPKPDLKYLTKVN